MEDPTPKSPIETKIDEIIAGNKLVKLQLNRRTAGVVAVCIVFTFVLFRLNRIGEYNQAANKINLENGNEIKQADLDIKHSIEILTNATGPDAQARSQATLARAIDDIRRSIDCTKLSDEGTYPACVSVVDRLDQVRAGLDPFTN